MLHTCRAGGFAIPTSYAAHASFEAVNALTYKLDPSGAAIKILGVKLHALGMGEHVGMQHIERLRRIALLLSHQTVLSVTASRPGLKGPA